MELVIGSYFDEKKYKYKDELIRSMKYLAKDKRTLFLGQSVKYSGNAIFNTLKEVDDKKLSYQYLKMYRWVLARVWLYKDIYQ